MIWFTSDPHFGHTNIIKYSSRPFADVREMNDELVKRHNALVKENDVVYRLGDFSLNKAMAKLYLPQLKGYHILIPGNHDHCHPVHTKKEEKRKAMFDYYMNAGFKDIRITDKLYMNGTNVNLHHMPYYEEGADGLRFNNLRLKDEGEWLLHGHVHTAWKTRDKMINVGVDVWDYAPVSWDQIAAIVNV